MVHFKKNYGFDNLRKAKMLKKDNGGGVRRFLRSKLMLIPTIFACLKEVNLIISQSSVPVVRTSNGSAEYNLVMLFLLCIVSIICMTFNCCGMVKVTRKEFLLDILDTLHKTSLLPKRQNLHFSSLMIVHLCDNFDSQKGCKDIQLTTYNFD